MRNHNSRNGRNPKSFKKEREKKFRKKGYMERGRGRGNYFHLLEFQDSGYVGVILLQICSYYMIGCKTLNSDLFLTGKLSVPKVKDLEER